MTKLLDRYVLGIFLPALVVFSFTLLFLFVAVDLAAKLARFFALKEVHLIPFMIQYYLFRIPMLANILIPSVMLFAPTFTVVKLARSNEILPIAAAGISLRRMSLPFIVAAVLSGLCMAAVDEFVLPGLGERISEDEELVLGGATSLNVEAYDGHTLIWAKQMDLTQKTLSGGVYINLLDDAMQPVEMITAKRCQWDAKLKRWIAFEGTVEHPAELIQIKGSKPRTRKEELPPEGYVVESALPLDAIRRPTSLTSHFIFATMSSLIQDMRKYPHLPSYTIKVHTRFSLPFSPIVLLLLGLPVVMTPHSKTFITSLVFCFVVAVGYYLVHFTCLDLGNKGMLPPVWAAWLPVGLFGTVGLAGFSRMRT
jgi:lipopolysaccharide export system permease protein